MVEAVSTSSRPIIKRTAFASTILLYILAGTSGLVSVSLKPHVFISEQRLAFQILYSIFLGCLSIGFCGVCGGFCRLESGVSVIEMDAVNVKPAKKMSGLSREDIRRGRT
jgi:hypothetical protein